VRLGDVVAVLVGLAVLGAVGYGAWWWLGRTLDAEEPEAGPGVTAAATADAYLDAWATSDHAAMAELVRDPPEDFEARHEQLWDALEPASLTVEAGALDDTVDGRATRPVTLTLELPDLSQPVSWDTELVLLRQAGRWAVSWSLATLHPDLRSGWGFAREYEEVGRAPILAVDGTPLADEGTLVTFGFEPSNVDDAEELAAAFETAIPGAGSRAERELGRSDLVDGWFYPVVTVSGARADTVAPLLRLPGVLRQESTGRALYTDDFARHVVGLVDEATAEQLDELGDDYEAGDRVGQFGLEAGLESQLARGLMVRIGLRDGDEGPLRVVLAEEQATGGGMVRTTIDIGVQQAVENTLVGLSGPTAIVVVDGADGAIRGSASRPMTGFNRAWDGRYAPGAAFGLVAAEALLAAGASPDDPVECPAELELAGRTIVNADELDLGATDLASAVTAGCRTTLTALATDAGPAALTEAAGRFGFEVEPDLPLPAAGGAFPTPEDGAQLTAAAAGQGAVTVSPLHLATMAAATVDGSWHPPYLLLDEGPGEPRALDDDALEPLTALLRAAVAAPDGVASAAAVAGQDVAGLAGTADGTDGVTHAWFVGTWRDLGIAVLIEDGDPDDPAAAAAIAGRLVRELASLAGETVEPGPDGAGSDPSDADEPDADETDAEDDRTELDRAPNDPGDTTEEADDGQDGATEEADDGEDDGEDDGGEDDATEQADDA
jgi:cell division protein FtsI/penicillin-binding protein 2